MPKIIISKIVYKQLANYMRTIGFRHETGGVLLGYKFIKIFYIIGITSPRNAENATRTTFILNGEEHTKDAEKIIKKSIPHPQIIGIWHSHTTGDNSFSLQDMGTNKFLARQFGNILSAIITQKRDSDDIKMTFYYISKNGKENLCKNRMPKGKWMENHTLTGYPTIDKPWEKSYRDTPILRLIWKNSGV